MEGKLTVIADRESSLTAAEIAAKTGHKEEDIVIIPDTDEDRPKKGFLAIASLAGMFMGLNKIAGVATEIEVKKAIHNVNPHNFPLFQINGYKIYAINEAAAQAKYSKIIRNKNKIK